jgi:hypothetical protein
MAIVRVHRPNLTKEEKAKREEAVRKALIEFYKESMKEKKQC